MPSVTQLNSSLKKQVSAPKSEQDDEIILQILGQLEFINPATSTFRRCKVSNTVDILLEHSNPKIVELSHQVVESWKTKLGTSNSKKKKAKIKTALGDTSTTSSKYSAQQEIIDSKKNTASAALDKASASIASISPKEVVPVPPLNSLPAKRQKCITLLTKSLSHDENKLQQLHMDEFSSHISTSGSIPSLLEPQRLAREIDTLVNQHFPQEYGFKIRTLKTNLQRNEDLRLRVRQGYMPSEKLVTVKVQDLATSELQEARKKAAEYAKAASRSDFEKERIKNSDVESQLQCYKCKNRKVIYHEMQTRSADEPATLFCHCLVCNFRWRM